MSTPTLLPAVVQAVRLALTSLLPRLLADQRPEVWLNATDRLLAHSVVDGARQALEASLGEALRALAPADHPTNESSLSHRLHSALGLLQFSGPAGVARFDAPFLHGCTLSVREEAAFLLAQGTAQEAKEVMAKYRPSVPSESTLKRISTHDGQALMQVWDEHLPELLAPIVHALAAQTARVSISADGAIVPMRGAVNRVDGDGPGGAAPTSPPASVEPTAAREYREARLITVTLYGEPDQEKERLVTLYDEKGKAYHEVVGHQRPRLATLVFGEMPTVEGPKGARAATALSQILAAIREACPQVPMDGCCDGGTWPQQTVDKAVGKRNRGTDFFHGAGHAWAAAKAAFGDTEIAHAWYKRERTKLLTEKGAAERLAQAIENLALCIGRTHQQKKVLRREAKYFRKRAKHMKYALWLSQDRVIGSGIVEAAVKRLISLRMKRTGATWTEKGGDAILALRSLRLSGLWNQAWQIHAAQQTKNAA